MKKKIPPRGSSGKKKARSPKKMVYRVSNWSTYNQALIDRGSLTVWLSEEALSGWHSQGPTQRGAQFFYSDLAIETTLTLRKLFDLGLRQSQGLVTSLFALMRVDLKAPSYSTLSRRQAELKIELPVRSKEEPIHLVVDSSGLKIFGEGEWKVRQQGWTQRRTWRKLHLGIDADTSEIVAQTLTTASRDDASQVKPMLQQIAGEIATCAGDGAYDRWSVHHLLAYPPDQNRPIESVIPPRRNAQARKAKRRYRHIEARNQRVQAIGKKGRKRWKKNSGYHRRSLAETGVFRFKGILSPWLRARSGAGQQIEARIGCSMLNQMIHLGKPETYKVEVSG